MQEWLEALRGLKVVLDTQGPLLYVGRLHAFDSETIVLHDADVHDRNDGAAGKELYVLEAKTTGIRVNRRRVFVRRCDVVSISALDDVWVGD